MRGWGSMTNRRSLLLAIEAQHFKTGARVTQGPCGAPASCALQAVQRPYGTHPRVLPSPFLRIALCLILRVPRTVRLVFDIPEQSASGRHTLHSFVVLIVG